MNFDGKKACNKKLIGARYFIDGFLAEYGQPLNTSENGDLLSPRDVIGHGTHTASTAAGSIALNVSYRALGFGTFRGGAPCARLAICKVCWNFGQGGCAYADILKAIDLAVHDGVDVISMSLGTDIPPYSDVDKRGATSFASFHAVEKGVVVVCAAGNSGPTPQSLSNTAPWLFTVAASSIDRSFPTPITLRNGQSFMVC
ncbi:hypothetical protein ACH5RR_017303 [Cinchona calisaya]|uniref:Peptidase S8/S53 domain-containing protein n=1 Tax=Cinchona calisaya TaxID=153742 RepID=A0ABD2ZYF3_9GENT